MNSIFNKVIRKTLKFLPFKLKFYFDKKYFIFIDEVEVLFNQLKGNKGSKFTMIDVGAHWGTTCYPFAELGWNIHAFEPDNNNRKVLLSNPLSSKIKIDNRAVSDVDNESLPFFTSDLSSGISSLTKFDKSHIESFTVKTITLKTYCKENSIEKINFLKIDTEGFDLFVLKGFDWNLKSRPELIICEFDEKKTKLNGYNCKSILTFLAGQGYKVCVSSWKKLESYGKGHEWDKFLNFDEAMNSEVLEWGNIIAATEEKEFMLEAFKN